MTTTITAPTRSQHHDYIARYIVQRGAHVVNERGIPHVMGNLDAAIQRLSSYLQASPESDDVKDAILHTFDWGYGTVTDNFVDAFAPRDIQALARLAVRDPEEAAIRVYVGLSHENWRNLIPPFRQPLSYLEDIRNGVPVPLSRHGMSAVAYPDQEFNRDHFYQQVIGVPDVRDDGLPTFLLGPDLLEVGKQYVALDGPERGGVFRIIDTGPLLGQRHRPAADKVDLSGTTRFIQTGVGHVVGRAKRYPALEGAKYLVGSSSETASPNVTAGLEVQVGSNNDAGQMFVDTDGDVFCYSTGDFPGTHVNAAWIDFGQAAPDVRDTTPEPTTEPLSEVDDLREQLRRARADAHTAIQRHRQDIETISEFLNQEARDRDWCNEYEAALDRINRHLTFPLELREQEYIATGTQEVTITLSVPISASFTSNSRSDDDLRNAAYEALDCLDAYEVEQQAAQYIRSNGVSINEYNGIEDIEWEEN